MPVRKVAARGNGPVGSQRSRPGRNRAWLFAWLTLGAGAGSGMAALIGTSFLMNLQTLFSAIAAQDGAPPQIEARTLFPPVPAVHKVINVYDPPPAAAPSSPSPKPPRATPTPSPRHSPRPTPTPGDN